jgi:Ni/Co efflux regulator RcnB
MKKLMTIIAILFSLSNSIAYARNSEGEHENERHHNHRVDDHQHSQNRGGRQSNGNKTETRLRARLSSSSSFATTARSKADYRVKNKETRFTVNLHLPFAADSISSIDEAKTLQVKVSLSRTGTTYAECSMVIDDDNEENASVEFKLDVRKKSNKLLRTKKGTCDIDLTKSGTQKGIPALQDGDTISIREESRGDFMVGTF